MGRIRRPATCVLFTALLPMACPLALSAVASVPDPGLNPNQNDHPASSLVDFSGLLDAPAGHRGFIHVGTDGHFYFADGTRARFWGMNVAAESLFQPHETIDESVSVLAHAGVNLVRLHDFDDVGGIIDYRRDDTQHLRSDRLDTLDYWIAECKKAGIYIYLDLLDYRHFKQGDGVPNAAALGRGAKPYALFDARLIQLQEQYAYSLLVHHVNPYTGHTYAADPAICLLELYDENGLFIKRSIVGNLADPYRPALAQRWNLWLLKRYGSTSHLAQSWRSTAVPALGPGENLEHSHIGLPSAELSADWDRHTLDPTASPARINEFEIFAYEIQANALTEIRDYLRSVGVRCPVTAVGSPNSIPDIKSISDSLDFIGINFYWDHPNYQPGRDWHMPSFYRGQNPVECIDSYSFAPTVGLSRVHGKPIVLREWNYCWPGSYRDAGMLEATAYSALQDVDALILFTYDTGRQARILSYFDISHDPTRWSLVGPMAEVFLKGLVQPARRSVSVAYSAVDVFHDHGYLSSVYDLAWQSRVENLFFDRRLESAPTDCVVASGNSAAAAYSSNRTIIWSDDRFEWPWGSATDWTASHRSGYRFDTAFRPAAATRFEGDLLPAGAVSTSGAGWRYQAADVRGVGFLPLGLSENGQYCLGCYDPRRQNYVFENAGDLVALRAALDGLKRWFGDGTGAAAIDQDTFLSDTGQLLRDSATGTLYVRSPTFQAIGGNLSDLYHADPHGLTIHSETDEGTVLALSLDGLPLTHSRRYLLQMVTTAHNLGELSRPPHDGDQACLLAMGRRPVLTYGEPVHLPTEVILDGRKLASVYIHGGTWMMLVDGDKCTFYCDTAGVRVQVPRFAETKVLEPGAPPAQSPTQLVQATDTFVIPWAGASVGLSGG